MLQDVFLSSIPPSSIKMGTFFSRLWFSPARSLALLELPSQRNSQSDSLKEPLCLFFERQSGYYTAHDSASKIYYYADGSYAALPAPKAKVCSLSCLNLQIPFTLAHQLTPAEVLTPKGPYPQPRDFEEDRVEEEWRLHKLNPDEYPPPLV